MNSDFLLSLSWAQNYLIMIHILNPSACRTVERHKVALKSFVHHKLFCSKERRLQKQLPQHKCHSHTQTYLSTFGNKYAADVLLIVNPFCYREKGC